jgi:hypothetical protein
MQGAVVNGVATLTTMSSDTPYLGVLGYLSENSLQA